MDSKDERAARLAAELRANLRKRKGQARAAEDEARAPSDKPPPVDPADA